MQVAFRDENLFAALGSAIGQQLILPRIRAQNGSAYLSRHAKATTVQVESRAACATVPVGKVGICQASRLNMLRICSYPSCREKLACSLQNAWQNAQAECICKIAVGHPVADAVASFSSARAQMPGYRMQKCLDSWSPGHCAFRVVSC